MHSPSFWQRSEHEASFPNPDVPTLTPVPYSSSPSYPVCSLVSQAVQWVMLLQDKSDVFGSFGYQLDCFPKGLHCEVSWTVASISGEEVWTSAGLRYYRRFLGLVIFFCIIYPKSGLSCSPHSFWYCKIIFLRVLLQRPLSQPFAFPRLLFPMQPLLIPHFSAAINSSNSGCFLGFFVLPQQFLIQKYLLFSALVPHCYYVLCFKMLLPMQLSMLGKLPHLHLILLC